MIVGRSYLFSLFPFHSLILALLSIILVAYLGDNPTLFVTYFMLLDIFLFLFATILLSIRLSEDIIVFMWSFIIPLKLVTSVWIVLLKITFQEELLCVNSSKTCHCHSNLSKKIGTDIINFWYGSAGYCTKFLLIVNCLSRSLIQIYVAFILDTKPLLFCIFKVLFCNYLNYCVCWILLNLCIPLSIAIILIYRFLHVSL